MSENSNTNHQQPSNTNTPERLSAVALTTAAAVAALNGSFQSSQTTPTSTNHNPPTTLSPTLLNSILEATTVKQKPTSSSSKDGTASTANGTRTVNPNGTRTVHLPTASSNRTSMSPFNVMNANQQQQPFPFPNLVMPTIATSTNGSHTRNATNIKGGKAVKQGIFHEVPLRRGKWTREEETYANAVIEAFEQGIIQTCENGITLRSFLSRKLHCQPMRISKKYAGQSIGKQVYLSRMDNHTVQNIAFNNENLAKLEFQFHMSIIQEGLIRDCTNNRQKLELARTHHQQQQQQAQVTAQQQSLQQSAGNTIGNPMPVYSHQFPFVTSMHQNGFIGHNRANGNGIAHQGARTAGPLTHPYVIPHAVASNTATATSGHTNNGTIFLNLGMATQATSLGQQQQRAKERTDQSQSMAAMNQTTSDIQKTLFDAFQDAQKRHYFAPPDEKTKTDSKKNLKLAQRSQSPPTKGEQQTKWLSETMSLVESLVPACDTRYNEEETPPTPTYTSKSFDDLHKLLGENIPEFQLTSNFDESKGVRLRVRGQSKKIDGQATKAANKLAIESTKPPTAIKPEKNTTTVTYHHRIDLNIKKAATSEDTTENNASKPVFLSPSDEYAFLAQQSAIEASKHSAYCDEPLKRSATPIVIDNKKKKTANGTQPLHLLGKIGAALLSKKNIKLHSKSHEGITNGSSQIQNANATVVSASEPSSSEVNSRVDSSTSSGTDDHSDSASSEGKSFSSSRGKRRVDNDSGLEKVKKIKVEEEEEEAPISMQ